MRLLGSRVDAVVRALEQVYNCSNASALVRLWLHEGLRRIVCRK